MARLITLPSELLLNVIEQVRFEDIERFTLCCKELYNTGQTRLQEHLDKKRTYTSVVCGPSTNPEWPNPFKLLQDVLSDEESAQYTTSLAIKDCNAEIDPDDNPDEYWYPEDEERFEEDAHPVLSGMKDQIGEKVHRCKYIAEYDTKSDDVNLDFEEYKWVYDILSGRRPDAALALLIVSFPNLQSLEISDRCWDADNFYDMISRVGWDCHWGSEESQSLTKLTTVSHNGKSGFLEDFGLMNLFSLLPSVQWLAGTYLYGAKAFQHRVWEDLEYAAPEGKEQDPESMNSSITNVSFAQSLLDTYCFDFLKRVPELRDFKYNHAGIGHIGRTMWWEPSGIVNLLSEHAGHSLVSLDLTGILDERVATWSIGPLEGDYPRHSTFVGSLAMFEVLENIRIDHDLFIDNDVHDGSGSQDFRTKDCIQAERWEDVSKRSARDRVQSLVDVLPASVETLTLVKPFESMKEAMIMFAGLWASRNNCFPLLREITLEDGMVFEQDMVDAYMEIGIELK